MKVVDPFKVVVGSLFVGGVGLLVQGLGGNSAHTEVVVGGMLLFWSLVSMKDS